MRLLQDVLVSDPVLFPTERVFKFTKSGMFTQILWLINIENVEDCIISVYIIIICIDN